MINNSDVHKVLRTKGRRYVDTIKRFIVLLKHVDGKKGITEIAQELKMRPATVSDYFAVLSELGLVEIRVVEGAPRKHVPVLTERGRCFLDCMKDLS